MQGAKLKGTKFGSARPEHWKAKEDNRLSEQISKVRDGTVGREEYGVNEADQITDIASGGPLHVSGSLNEQGEITTGLSPAPALTEADNSFSTWVNTDFITGAYVTDWTGNTTSTCRFDGSELRVVHAVPSEDITIAGEFSSLEYEWIQRQIAISNQLSAGFPTGRM